MYEFAGSKSAKLVVSEYGKLVSRGCMHRRLIIEKTWLSAISYAQSRISLVFCRSLGFLVPWLSSLTADSDLADFFYVCMEKKLTFL